MTEETLEIEQQLDKLLTDIQPNLQDVIKRSFTNVAIQQTKNGEQIKTDVLEDTSYFAKNTQVTLSRLELVKSPTFHMQSVSLDLKSMSLSLKCSLGEVNVRGLYSAFNENLYNLIPVMSEGHLVISLSNMIADVKVGLVLVDDAFSFINPAIEFIHDEVLVKLSWPSPQRNGGYEFTTTEQLAKHIDDLPLTAAISLALFALLRQKLQRHLEKVLYQATSVSDVVGCNPSMLEAYSAMVNKLSESGNRVIDMILINMRRTLLQTCTEILELPPLHATFLHKIGSVSFVGKFETELGWVKNLASINRVNDVTVTRPDPGRTCFHVTLKIKDLQIGYDEYRVKALGVGCTGRVVSSFSDNSIHMALCVGLARWEPYAQLDDLRVHHCGGMDMHITGLGPLSGELNSVRGWIRGAVRAHAQPAIDAQLQHELRTALTELPLTELIREAQT
ncbi:uncharacterized protein LOC125048916 [Pieris napi]|uniref:Uncharacterized protein n=1 Tax=Pieris macdunnoughi TaxID=345717 RepID=A0A821WS69_9NEOP|nr:uncharacterized protein LOC125048916 [Pieris napi]CAF4932427.1 unnamed protein product [Pieris macdunnoughi]